jgi:hypothetical protein
MKLSCSIVVLTCSAAVSHAQSVQNIRLEWANDQHTLARAIVVDDVLDPASTWYYDNYRDQVRGGQSQRLEMYRVGSDEVGDLVVSDVGGGRLRGENFTLTHVGQTGVGTYITKRNRWYDQSGQLIREFVFDIDMSLAHLTPGLLKNYSAGDGFWDFLNLDLPASSYISHQWFNPIGMDAADLGQAIAGPRTIGYSSQFIRNFTTGQDIDLGSDQRNLCLAVRVDPIPSPSSLSLFAASSLLALRRRRPQS